MNDRHPSNPEPSTNPDEARPDAFTRALLDTAAGRDLEAGLPPEEHELITTISNWLPDLLDVVAQHSTVADTDDDSRHPVRRDDPVAQMLGLIEDGSVRLDGRRLASVREAAGLDIRQLATRLQRRGWDVTISTVSAWERNRTNPPPATINAIAEELGVAADQILVASTDTSHTLDAVFDDARIATFLNEWAKEANVSAESLTQHSKRLLATAGKRNATSATPETVLAILRHFKNLPGFENQA
jgi:transcriptional regulator with XRE-family HTH domain